MLLASPALSNPSHWQPVRVLCWILPVFCLCVRIFCAESCAHGPHCPSQPITDASPRIPRNHRLTHAGHTLHVRFHLSSPFGRCLPSSSPMPASQSSGGSAIIISPQTAETPPSLSCLASPAVTLLLQLRRCHALLRAPYVALPAPAQIICIAGLYHIRHVTFPELTGWFNSCP